MSSNYFCGSSLYELPLDRELCQRLHYEAIERAINGSHIDEYDLEDRLCIGTWDRESKYIV
jgi:hypothetical protein